jgi:hypothetical protein
MLLTEDLKSVKGLNEKHSCVVERHSTAVHRNTAKCTLVRYWYSYYYLDEYCYCHCYLYDGQRTVTAALRSAATAAANVSGARKL